MHFLIFLLIFTERSPPDLHEEWRRGEVLGVVESHVRVEADPARVDGDDGEGPVVE